MVLGERCYHASCRVASPKTRGVDDVGRPPKRRPADCRRGQRLGSEAPLLTGLVPCTLRFPGALPAVNACGTGFLGADAPAKAAPLEALYDTLCTPRIGQRPDRVEPRVVFDINANIL
jgi:hypothetical protein